MTEKIVKNQAEQRYELQVGDYMAFARYHEVDGVVQILHVEAPQELRGTGAAGRLMDGMMRLIRAEGRKAYPVCTYALAWLRKHPEYQNDVR
jgi:predicted GNAT family acetyltransferase